MRRLKISSRDNLSPTLLENTMGASFADCQQICATRMDCLQFASSADGCTISTREVMLGQSGDGTRSGWFVDRIDRWMRLLDNCAGYEGWMEV